MLEVTIYEKAAKKMSAKENEYYIQTAWIRLKNAPHPEKFDFFPPRDLPGGGYAPGEYLFDESQGFKVDRGRLVVADLILVPKGSK